MKQINDRRRFLKKIGLASGGLIFLSSSSILNARGNNRSPYKGYNPFAERNFDMRTSLNTEEHITVMGNVFDRSNLKTLANIQLEVWHLSSGSEKYRHQAKLKTNELGEFKFLTDLPGKEPGKSPRIFFKISSENRSYFTELVIGTHDAYITDAHWVENQCLAERMQPVKNKSTIHFNLAI